MVGRGSALFAGSAREFIEMAPASSLTAHLTREFNRRWGSATEYEIRERRFPSERLPLGP